jgi:dolichol kinase
MKPVLEFDVHWFRRVFHTFGAFFLVYYKLPDVGVLKYGLPILLLFLASLIELLRLKGRISSDHFFGLRVYEKKRVGSFLFFGIALFLLLLFFPQQIAVPCILCACFADPIMGEVRHRFGKNEAYLIGFFVCMLFFGVTWYQADVRLFLLVSFVGAAGAVIGETGNFWRLDDDFMIQMLPALLLVIVWFVAQQVGVGIPNPLISPSVLCW